MNIITRVVSTSFDDLKRRIIKLTRFGKNDVKSAFECAPYGTDTNPIKNMVAIYSETAEKGRKVIIGYINPNQLADVGEHRIYSTDAAGNLKAFLWLKKDGTFQLGGIDGVDGGSEIVIEFKGDGTIALGGDADNLVRYGPLADALSNEKTGLQAELIKIQTAITGLGGAYVPGTITIDISGAKINEIKSP